MSLLLKKSLVALALGLGLGFGLYAGVPADAAKNDEPKPSLEKSSKLASELPDSWKTHYSAHLSKKFERKTYLKDYELVTDPRSTTQSGIFGTWVIDEDLSKGYGAKGFDKTPKSVTFSPTNAPNDELVKAVQKLLDRMAQEAKENPEWQPSIDKALRVQGCLDEIYSWGEVEIQEGNEKVKSPYFMFSGLSQNIIAHYPQSKDKGPSLWSFTHRPSKRSHLDTITFGRSPVRRPYVWVRASSVHERAAFKKGTPFPNFDRPKAKKSPQVPDGPNEKTG